MSNKALKVLVALAWLIILISQFNIIFNSEKTLKGYIIILLSLLSYKVFGKKIESKKKLKAEKLQAERKFTLFLITLISTFESEENRKRITNILMKMREYEIRKMITDELDPFFCEERIAGYHEVNNDDIQKKINDILLNTEDYMNRIKTTQN